MAQAGSIVRNNRIRALFGTGIHLRQPSSDSGGIVEGNSVRSVRGDGIRLYEGTVTKNYLFNAHGDAAAFGPGVTYGMNRFPGSVTGGISMGTNSCGNSVC